MAAGVAQGGASLLDSLTSPEGLGLLVGIPAVAKLLPTKAAQVFSSLASGKFGYDIAKGLSTERMIELANALESKDPGKIAAALTSVAGDILFLAHPRQKSDAERSAELVRGETPTEVGPTKKPSAWTLGGLVPDTVKTAGEFARGPESRLPLESPETKFEGPKPEPPPAPTPEEAQRAQEKLNEYAPVRPEPPAEEPEPTREPEPRPVETQPREVRPEGPAAPREEAPAGEAPRAGRPEDAEAAGADRGPGVPEDAAPTEAVREGGGGPEPIPGGEPRGQVPPGVTPFVERRTGPQWDTTGEDIRYRNDRRAPGSFLKERPPAEPELKIEPPGRATRPTKGEGARAQAPRGRPWRSSGVRRRRSRRAWRTRRDAYRGAQGPDGARGRDS